MVICPRCGHENEDNSRNCTGCRINLLWALENQDEVIDRTYKMPEEAARAKALARRIADVIVTTTLSVEGRHIAQYLDVVTQEVALGTGFLSQLSASVADSMGKRSAAFESKLRSARQTAVSELRRQAFHLQADAVVGLALNYFAFANDLIMVVATGTAVQLAPPTLGQHRELSHDSLAWISARDSLALLVALWPLRPAPSLLGDLVAQGRA